MKNFWFWKTKPFASLTVFMLTIKMTLVCKSLLWHKKKEAYNTILIFNSKSKCNISIFLWCLLHISHVSNKFSRNKSPWHFNNLNRQELKTRNNKNSLISPLDKIKIYGFIHICGLLFGKSHIRCPFEHFHWSRFWLPDDMVEYSRTGPPHWRQVGNSPVRWLFWGTSGLFPLPASTVTGFGVWTKLWSIFSDVVAELMLTSSLFSGSVSTGTSCKAEQNL